MSKGLFSFDKDDLAMFRLSRHDREAMKLAYGVPKGTLKRGTEALLKASGRDGDPSKIKGIGNLKAR